MSDSSKMRELKQRIEDFDLSPEEMGELGTWLIGQGFVAAIKSGLEDVE